MNRQILRLAIPNIISNLSVPLLSSVDTALVGRLDGVYYLGALAVGGMIFNFLYWGFGFLRMGTTGLTATAYGGKNDAEVGVVLSRAVLTAILGSALLLVSQYLLFSGAMLIVSTSDEVREMAALYFYIRIWDAPAVLALFAIQGWFLGMQNARFPMYITIFINLLNIGLNIFFIYGLGMTVDGVAYGTVIAQYLGLIFALWLFFRYYGRSYIHLGRKTLLAIEGLKRFFSVSRDIFIRTMSLIFTYSFFTIQSAALGDEYLAINTILMQLWYIMAYGVDGFAYAAESITGKYTGRGDRAGLLQAVKLLIAWGLGLGVAFSGLYFLFDEHLIRLFTDNPELIALGLTFFAWTIAAPLINSFCFMLDGIFIGATVTGPMRDSMLISTFLVFIPAYYLTVDLLGNHALWLAMTAYMLARGATLLWFLPRKVLARVG